MCIRDRSIGGICHQLIQRYDYLTAGLPILAVEDIEGYIPYPDKSGKELFALHVD